MGAVLIVIGAVALFAAIVGGGIKIRDIEVGSVPSLWRQGLLAVFGIVIGLIGLGLVVEDPNGSSNTERLASNGLANTLAAASENMAGTTSVEAKAMDPDAGGPVDAAMAPREEPRDIYVHNSCGEPINLWLAYSRDGRWKTGGAWNFAGGESGGIRQGDVTVATAKPEIYFYAKSTTSATEWSGNTTVGGLKNLTKGLVTVDDSGRYLLDISCN